MSSLEMLSYANDRTEIEINASSKAIDCPELDFCFKSKPVYHFFKRVADIVLSSLALLAFSPLLILVCLAIVIKDPGNPFFKQDRVGKDGKLFKIYKIRSMYKDAEEKKITLISQNESEGAVFKIHKDPRVLGRVGRFIRKTSIDELPQLINILRGDMSIIGPRPFVPEEQSLMSDDRLLVKPGLSCYWQVNGKNSLSAAMSDYYDRKYIMDRSFITDVVIILRTVKVVFCSANE